MIKKNKTKKYMLNIFALMLTGSIILTGCGSGVSTGSDTTSTVQAADSQTSTEAGSEANSGAQIITDVASNTGGVLDTSAFFTERDLVQTADLTGATTITVSDGEDVHITQEGVYLIQGTASNMTVYVEAEDTAKVQLVLDGISITNTDVPCIYVLSADKVFVTTSSDSSLTVTGTFALDSENADAAIFSCADLVLNGTAALTIQSSDVGVDTKDDLKVTGGTYNITAETKAFEANDSIRIADGNFTLVAGTDGLHAENTDDDSKGFVYIAGGTFDIQAGDDSIRGTSVVQIDGGTFDINSVEGIEATYVQINGGTFDIAASDDGINATLKSNSYAVVAEITGGEINITMGQGDTDALDSNGDLIISGGSINITANSAFDYDGAGTYSGGTLIVNGQEVTELTPSMMGGGPGMGGNRPGGNRIGG